MSDDRSARLALPYLHAGQAQKELDHNEALALLDIAVQPVVEAVGIDAPPVDAPIGACWIVGPAPVGGWAGHAGAIAGWTGGGWRFVAPRRGMTVTRASDGVTARYDENDWVVGESIVARLVVGSDQVIGARQPAIENATGGGTIDEEARVALHAVLGALRAHGLIEA